MAQQREARVAAVTELSATTRVLELEPAERLDFVGGQYLIFNSGLTLPDGKLAKRAYSILSPDAEQARITIAVRKIGDGPASSWMHARAVGDVVPFSGPWGKWLADDARPRRTLVVATDTGITAALGLVRGAAFAPQRATAELVWLVERDDYFVPESFVRAALPAGAHALRVHPGDGGEDVPLGRVEIAPGEEIAVVALGPTRWGWPAAVALATLAPPRLLLYMLMSLIAAVREPRVAVPEGAEPSAIPDAAEAYVRSAR